MKNGLSTHSQVIRNFECHAYLPSESSWGKGQLESDLKTFVKSAPERKKERKRRVRNYRTEKSDQETCLRFEPGTFRLPAVANFRHFVSNDVRLTEPQGSTLVRLEEKSAVLNC